MTAPRFDLPSTSSLVAFEATARLGGVIRAATELRTSQSAISRHIRNLENRFGAKLFQRQSRGIVLTEAGEDYYLAVKSVLEELHAASYGLRTEKTSVIIGCTPEIAHEVLLPVFPEFRRTLDTEVNLRILSCDHDTVPLLMPLGIDIIFEYGTMPSGRDSIKILDEAIMPVASPEFVDRSREVLRGHPCEWNGVVRLGLSSRNEQWATWNTWFKAHGCTAPQAPVVMFENYQFLLASAADSEGLAMGWQGFVDHHIGSGRLIGVGPDWLQTGICLYARLTKSGKQNPYATLCLEHLVNFRNSAARRGCKPHGVYRN